MKDIYSLIRQKEGDIERIQHELDALRLSAKLLEEDSRTTATASAAATSVYAATAPKPQTGGQPTAAPSTWASAKQFP